MVFLGFIGCLQFKDKWYVEFRLSSLIALKPLISGQFWFANKIFSVLDFQVVL